MESFADFDNATILDPKAPVDEEGKLIERWAPLGANDSPDLSMDDNLSGTDSASSDKMRNMTEEHEILNSSLLLLTSHFAQVQFRLEQVLQADPNEKETLLRDLEQFAWKGVPDLSSLKPIQSNYQDGNNEPLEDQQKKNMPFIIDQLKSQLNDLEQFAYKSGEIEQPPTQSILEKQRLVLEELGKHLGLNASEFPSLTEEEIKERVNAGLNQLTNPIKTNEALVNQLKTQIIDLERFIDFLHDEGTPDSVIVKALEAFRRSQQDQGSKAVSSRQQYEKDEGGQDYGEGGYHIGLSRRRPRTARGSFDRSSSYFSKSKKEIENQKSEGLITRALTMLQVFATIQLAGRRANMRQQTEKHTKTAVMKKNLSQPNAAKGNHWGDIRANFEIAIDIVLEKAEKLRRVREEYLKKVQTKPLMSDLENVRQPGDGRMPLEYRSGKIRDPEYVKAERDLNLAVRKQFCPALEVLIEHGSRVHATKQRGMNADGTGPSFLGSLLATIGCFSRNRLEAPSYPNKFADSSDDSESECADKDGSDEESRERNDYVESEEDRRARILRKRNAQSSAWAIFLKYYILTNGRSFNDTPARKLSESFALDIIGGKVVTPKQHLLSSMGTVLQEFNKYKRSEATQFKALVCIGLNTHRLVSWLKLVLRSPLIVQYMYHPWSYVSSTGFDDALQSLSRLSSIDFDLPFDANIRHLQSISEAF
ncbi:unnamed protein product [Rodentolepis nana]|uniref:RUN domain-containing protein n=1 Tax=Rodentolepis nana TaxID=102285 RepID=A0A158QHF5_RODNA|nr:unnamed protein product [Rodentolepis nana]